MVSSAGLDNAAMLYSSFFIGQYILACVLLPAILLSNVDTSGMGL